MLITFAILFFVSRNILFQMCFNIPFSSLGQSQARKQLILKKFNAANPNDTKYPNFN
jgi:hypothetical protein